MTSLTNPITLAGTTPISTIQPLDLTSTLIKSTLTSTLTICSNLNPSHTGTFTGTACWFIPTTITTTISVASASTSTYTYDSKYTPFITTGGAIGIAFGLVVLLALGGLVVWFVLRRRREVFVGGGKESKEEVAAWKGQGHRDIVGVSRGRVVDSSDLLKEAGVVMVNVADEKERGRSHRVSQAVSLPTYDQVVGGQDEEK